MSPAERDRRLSELCGLGRCYGGLSHGQGDTVPWLVQLCREWVRPDFVMAEVGCYRGVSTRVFACFAERVYAVDAWGVAADMGYPDFSRAQLEEAEAEFRRACECYRNIVVVKRLSEDAAANFAGGLDAVYLDGDHREGMFGRDVRAWLPRLKAERGLLMGHDYSQVGSYFGVLGLPEPAAVYPEDSWVIRVKDVRKQEGVRP